MVVTNALIMRVDERTADFHYAFPAPLSTLHAQRRRAPTTTTPAETRLECTLLGAEWRDANPREARDHRLHGIGKVFQAGSIECQVLTDIHLNVRQGEFVSIAGPSGCGKTTLLSLMGLLDVPTHGELRFAGQSVQGLGRAERARLRNRHIGFVFQAFNLIEDLSVAENVELPLTFRENMPPRERARRVRDALGSVGMTHRMRHYPSQLSGGQQQRVAVARALAGDPSILLADEPTGNLDLHNGEIVMALLSRLHAAGRTICMVTHDERFGAVADRTIRLLDGRVVDESTFRQLQSEAESGLDERRISESFQ